MVGSGQWEARLTDVHGHWHKARELQPTRETRPQGISTNTGRQLIAIMKFEVRPEPKCHLGKASWRKVNSLKDGTFMPKKARNLAESAAPERGI